MDVYTMRITTEQANGKNKTETVRHLTADQLAEARENVRRNTPRGSVRPVKVVKEH